jgi:hypothetical protein
MQLRNVGLPTGTLKKYSFRFEEVCPPEPADGNQETSESLLVNMNPTSYCENKSLAMLSSRGARSPGNEEACPNLVDCFPPSTS